MATKRPPTAIRATKVLVDNLCQQAMLIPVDAAAALVQEIARTDAILPVLDPTGWMQIARTLPGHERAAQAFLTFRQELERIAQDAQ